MCAHLSNSQLSEPTTMTIRPAAVAGTWYPASAGALAHEVDQYVERASDGPSGAIRAIVAPHAGIMFSGPVGACAYKAAAKHQYDVAVLVGPSHFVAFEGVALYPDGAFASPFGPIAIDTAAAAAIGAADVVRALPSVHAREHSLEMQLPFLGRLLPGLPIVPLLMGQQDRSTIERLAQALADGLASRRALLVASTDLSHYFDAATAATLDGAVCDCIAAFSPERLLDVFERCPEGERGRRVGCGIGPAISVMMAARALGAKQARVLRYAHSGEVSRDFDGVVGYLAAALGTFDVESGHVE
jgi:AmmeMemoRadiSam system protein B